MNEKLEKLNQEIEKTEARLRRAQHKEKNAGTPDKDPEPEGTDAPALHQRGNAGKPSPHPESVTDGQVSTILKVLFCRSDTKRLVAQVLTENRKEDAE